MGSLMLWLRESLHAALYSGQDFIAPIFDKYGIYLSVLGAVYALYICVKVTTSVLGEAKVLLFGRWLAIDLLKQGKWAVVTGATDGIGKAYCEELAKRGLNIVLISRSPEKLNAVAKQIESTTSVSTKCITADFSHSPEFYQHIEEELQNMDVGVLVNNVGMLPKGNLTLATFDVALKKDIINSLSVNLLSCLMMSRLVLPGMIKRKRGVIVNIASGVVYMEAERSLLYYCTKVAMDRMSSVLKDENEKKGVTIQCVTPFFVKTNMTAVFGRSVGEHVFFPTATQFVRESINTIGLKDRTCGYFMHSVQWLLWYTVLPSCVRQPVYKYLRAQFTRDVQEHDKNC